MNNPIARKEKLVVQEMPDEVLVYDLNTHKAHCLNKTAAMVWSHCDGKNSAAKIASLIAQKQQTAVEEDVVWLALKQLGKANLLQESLSLSEDSTRFSRREIMRRLGWAATMALPLVTSVVVPTTVAAASCVCISANSNGFDCGSFSNTTGICYGNNNCTSNSQNTSATCNDCLSGKGNPSWSSC